MRNDTKKTNLANLHGGGLTPRSDRAVYFDRPEMGKKLGATPIDSNRLERSMF